jgi:hypothetical protein
LVGRRYQPTLEREQHQSNEPSHPTIRTRNEVTSIRTA